MLDQLNHMQETPIVAMLAALLEHPQFRQGLRDGYGEAFDTNYEPAPLTEDEMIDEVELNLSRRVQENCKIHKLVYGVELPPFLYDLGCVLGVISKGLSYTHTSADGENAKETVICS